jgi:hypothetical protein
MIASAFFNLLINPVVSCCESSLCQLKRRVKHRCCGGEKKERNSSKPAQTMTVGRGMSGQFNIALATFSFFYYLLASLFSENKV